MHSPYSFRSSNIIDRDSWTRDYRLDDTSAVLRLSFPRYVKRGDGILKSETRSQLDAV